MTPFERSLELGLATEKRVRAVPELGMFALTLLSDTERINGKGPRMIGPRGRELPVMTIVHPDVELDAPGQHYGMEIKGKTRFTETRVSGEPEHGIECRLLDNYLQWQQEKERKVLLVVDEGNTGEILIASFNKLMTGSWTDQYDGRMYARPRLCTCPTPRGCPQCYCDGSRMAYFGRSQFLLLHQGPPEDLPLFKGKVQVSGTLNRVTDFKVI